MQLNNLPKHGRQLNAQLCTCANCRQQEQAILAFLIAHGSQGDGEFLKHARAAQVKRVGANIYQRVALCPCSVVELQLHTAWAFVGDMLLKQRYQSCRKAFQTTWGYKVL
jgi:hypothetical protein